MTFTAATIADDIGGDKQRSRNVAMVVTQP